MRIEFREVECKMVDLQVSWSPSGQWLAILASRSTGGNVMFVDTTTSEAKRTNVVEHPGFTQVKMKENRNLGPIV